MSRTGTSYGPLTDTPDWSYVVKYINNTLIPNTV